MRQTIGNRQGRRKRKLSASEGRGHKMDLEGSSRSAWSCLEPKDKKPQAKQVHARISLLLKPIPSRVNWVLVQFLAFAIQSANIFQLKQWNQMFYILYIIVYDVDITVKNNYRMRLHILA